MNKKLISIIIPVYNNLSYTQKCLKSLYEFESTWLNSNEFNANIIVVDDGSSDGTSDWIKNNYPDVHVLQGDGNLWWSGGINRGVQYAVNELLTDYTLWWNNDITPTNNYFDGLLNILKDQTENVLIGSKIFFHDKEIIWGMGGKFDPFKGTHFMYGWGKHDKEEFNSPIIADWFPGMGTCIHRSVYSSIGYLDEVNFPQYHGDSDFTYRAKKNGFELIAFPELVLFNDNSNTGLVHQGNFKKLLHSLISIKSNYNIKKNFHFYKKHSKSIRAYLVPLRKYYEYIGGYFKWKFLNFFGFKKTQ